MATNRSDEFVERRMAAHKRWQHDTERELIEEIIGEVQSLPKREPRALLHLFEDRGLVAVQ